MKTLIEIIKNKKIDTAILIIESMGSSIKWDQFWDEVNNL